jgi:hypothetical protein
VAQEDGHPGKKAGAGDCPRKQGAPERRSADGLPQIPAVPRQQPAGKENYLCGDREERVVVGVEKEQGEKPTLLTDPDRSAR